MVKFWLCLVVGVLCVLVWLGGRQEAAETTKWPSVPGVITDADVSEHRTRDGSIERQATIKYKYSVAGRAYEGDRVKVETTTDTSAVTRYPKGTPVTVFYNPAHSEAAVLEPGKGGMLMWGLVGIGCLAFSAYTLLQRLQRR